MWDDFFSLGDKSNPGAKYRLADIAAMDREEYKNVVDEFFFNVYYRYYTENGITGAHLYDPDTLDWMGLPPDATAEDIKKRFRELAKKYHPDTGRRQPRFYQADGKLSKSCSIEMISILLCQKLFKTAEILSQDLSFD